MKPKLTKYLSLMLAGMLQVLPLIRSALPTIQAMASSPTGSLILKWAVGGAALLGYDAVSKASGIAISPPFCVIGQPYSGTITYSGAFAGEVGSMSISNTCLGSHVFVGGLTITYSNGYTATISGTPTGTIGTFPFTVNAYQFSGCNNGNEHDTRSASLIVQNSTGAAAPPAITAAPQNAIYPVGSTVQLSGGATGNPAPSYYWKQGLNYIPGATNNTLTIASAQLTNAGVYTLVASNFANGTPNLAVAACYLTMAIPPGSNTLVPGFTNYVIANTPVTMTSYMTNAPNGSNSYAWQYQFVNIGVTTSNLSLTAAQTVPNKSGTYTINFNSYVGTTQVVTNQSYDSYWQFGYLPVITNQPTSVTVSPGSNATFTCTLAGGNYPNIYLEQNGSIVAFTSLAGFNPNTATTTTNISITLTNVTAANAGTYNIVIQNFWGTTTSSPVSLTVTSSLSVSSPVGQTNYAGKNISLSVTPSGTAPFTYQWQKGGANLSNGGELSGVNTNLLTIFPAAPADSGNYQVVVANSSGSVTSTVATVSVLPLPSFGLTLNSGNPVLSASGGVVGSNYVVEVSTNVANANGWVPLLTNTVPPGGNISFTDTNALTGQRYYRVQFP